MHPIDETDEVLMQGVEGGCDCGAGREVCLFDVFPECDVEPSRLMHEISDSHRRRHDGSADGYQSATGVQLSPSRDL